MPLKKSASSGAFRKNVKAEVAAGKPKNQALAIAYRIQRDARKMADGGTVYDDTEGDEAKYDRHQRVLAERANSALRSVGPDNALDVPDKNTVSPYDVMQYRTTPQADVHLATGGRLNLTKINGRGGLINSAVAGRTDKLPMGVHNGSYVIPADVVSSIGQGNTMSGASSLNRLFKMGPYGSAAPQMPSASPRRRFASGGAVGEPVDIIAAGGEYIVPPEKIAEIGGGDIARGHDVLDEMVKHIRQKSIKTLKKLPGPKK